jgi:hypothetical protein
MRDDGERPPSSKATSVASAVVTADPRTLPDVKIESPCIPNHHRERAAGTRPSIIGNSVIRLA